MSGGTNFGWNLLVQDLISLDTLSVKKCLIRISVSVAQIVSPFQVTVSL